MAFIIVPFLLFTAFPVSADKKEERLWEDEIIYSLLVDRFNNGDNHNDFDVNLKDPYSYQGGDFQGIIDRLDYLKDMGFTAIQLSPIFQNEDGGYHGEWVTDFYQPEEHFGTMDDFKKLVEQTHKRGLKIILEFEMNQIGKKHEWMKDPKKKDWIETNSTSNHPTLNLNNQDLQSYLIDAAKWWIEETKIDGYTVLISNNSPKSFWQQFAVEMKSVHENFFLLALMSEYDVQTAAEYQKAGFDGVADAGLNEPLRHVFSSTDVSFMPLFNQWEENMMNFDQPYRLAAYFDHKNMSRFTKDMVENRQFPGSRWKMALAYMYTQPEIPFIYYGTEIAVNGGEVPENRTMMNFRTDEELIEYITNLGRVRNSQKALTRGTMEVLYEKDGMVVFKREYENDTVVVAINNTVEDQKVVVKADQLEEDMELRGILGTDMVRSNNGEYQIFIERENAEIYKLANKTGYNIPFIIAMFGVFVVFALFMYIVWKRGKNINPYES